MNEPSIANNLRKLRFAHDEMTQVELASIVNVTRQTISALEAGRYTPTLELALKFATVFDTTIGQVFYWEDEESAKKQYQKSNKPK